MKSEAATLKIWVEDRNEDNSNPEIRRIEIKELKAESINDKRKAEINEIPGETTSSEMHDPIVSSYMPTPGISKASVKQISTTKALPIPDFSKKVLELPLVQKSKAIAEIIEDEPLIFSENEFNAVDEVLQEPSEAEIPIMESSISINDFTLDKLKNDTPIPIVSFSENAFVSSLLEKGEQSPGPVPKKLVSKSSEISEEQFFSPQAESEIIDHQASSQLDIAETTLSAQMDAEEERITQIVDQTEKEFSSSEKAKDYSPGLNDIPSSPKIKIHEAPLPDLKKKTLAFSFKQTQDVDEENSALLEADIPPPMFPPANEKTELSIASGEIFDPEEISESCAEPTMMADKPIETGILEEPLAGSIVIEEPFLNGYPDVGIKEIVNPTMTDTAEKINEEIHKASADSVSSPISLTSTTLSPESVMSREISENFIDPVTFATMESSIKPNYDEPDTLGIVPDDSDAEEIDIIEKTPHSYVAEAIQYLQHGIEERKIYPEAARRRKTEGRIQMLVQIKANGERASRKILKKSGSAVLDKAAIKLIDSLFPVVPPPGEEIEVVLEIVYDLQ